jgi:hypothetical protein
MAFTVALLGIDGSGKTLLAAALRQELAQQAPDVEVVIDDIPAPAEQHRYDLTLLLALAPSEGPNGEAADALLRDALQSAGIAFQIVFGQGAERAKHALRAIGSAMGRTLVRDDPALITGRGPWSCDNCSDPDCEHRLFTGLLARP